MTNFTELRAYRRGLSRFCASHIPSIEAFRSGISYRRELTPLPEPAVPELRHLTSTATCLESLGEAAEPSSDLPDRWAEFSLAALGLPAEKWTSEGSAAIYCRCRALPLVIRGLQEYDARIEQHLDRILLQLAAEGRFAIGEADPQEERETWYPANAFHTAWTLDILARFIAKFQPCAWLEKNGEVVRRQSDVMLLWARQVLGLQIALHDSASALRDTDQLAWALACVLRRTKEWTWVAGEQDLIRQAVAAIFSTQDKDVGNWPTFRPLFHYRKAGNAYCYIFETLSALLRVALQPEAGFLRAQLKPHCSKLAQLWRYAVSTGIPSEVADSGVSLVAWSSGHRAQLSAPESWATASVYSFAQLLRRLIGVWTRETALEELNHVPLTDSRIDAEAKLRQRGATWSERPVSHDLNCLFVNPVRLAEAQEPSADPDKAPIARENSRSAILYGPPGTSKTTLAKSIAGALGWDYVEIHASHFVAEGLPSVQKRADDIFARLMELDRAVVLFDEIDELVREREEDKADVFGRFLTTSMLPKVAELWSARKILYFVATNHVDLFDAAILRSQRFDTMIFVPPPSFEVKVLQLRMIVGLSGREIDLAVSADECEKALARVSLKKKPESQLPKQCILAKFVLLRWDQLDELAYRLRASADPGARRLRVGVVELSEALEAIADSRLARIGPYQDYQKQRDFARRDFGRQKVWLIDGEPPAGLRCCMNAGGKWWLVGPLEHVEEFGIAGWQEAADRPGVVRITV